MKYYDWLMIGISIVAIICGIIGSLVILLNWGRLSDQFSLGKVLTGVIVYFGVFVSAIFGSLHNIKSREAEERAKYTD